MPVALGQNPDHGFDEPLGLLSDCHRRIERFLEVLVAAVKSRQGGALGVDERQALRRATEYFRVAAPRHVQDEEESLFPRLRASNDPRVPAALAELQRLEADHESADRKQRDVDALVARWLDAGTLDAPSTGRLHDLLTELQAIYRNHIALEDDHIFSLAADVLSKTEINGLGREMAKRRGLTADPPIAPPRSGT